MVALAFTEGFDRDISLVSMNRECTNWYPKFISGGIQDGQEIVLKRLIGTPGQNQLATTGTAAAQANRGRIRMDGIPYFVNGTSLFRFNADNTTTSLGTVTGSGKVSMAQNGIQVMVLVPGGDGFIFNKDTAVFAQITDADFVANGQPQIVIFIDGFFQCNTDGKKDIISNLNDGTAWNALDFGTAESDPDAIESLVKFRNQSYILGTKTIEGKDNVGGSDYPFLRNGIFLDKGVFARFSVVLTTDSFMFIGGGADEDPAVWAFLNGELKQISNTGVDLLLESLSKVELDQVASYAYRQKGSTFVAWELPLETITYGVDTGKWHNRKSEIIDGAGFKQIVGWRSTGLMTAYDKLICFDTQDGRIGEVSLDIFDEYGTKIQREVDPMPLRAETSTFFVPRFEVTTASGVGDASTPDPKMRMAVSKNGTTFPGERIRRLGKKGEVNQRQVWRQLGRFKRVGLLRVFMSEAVRPLIIAMDADIRLGRA